MKNYKSLLKQYKNLSFKVFIANINNDNKYIDKYNYKMKTIEMQLNLQGIKIN